MSLFLILMVSGLLGLVWMALPGLLQHGGGHAGHAGHPVSGGHGAAAGHGVRAPRLAAGRGWSRLLPEPRSVLSVMALLGAFGNVAERWLHWSFLPSLVCGLVVAGALERVALRPLWRFALGFQGQPSSPLGGLVLEEAHAVTAFRNGKGIVQTVRDGRSVQLSARLVEAQQALSVRVGERLRIEDVDPETENVTVSLHPENRLGT